MIRRKKNKNSGMAIPIVIAIVLILAISAMSLHILMKQGRKQITTIVDEIVLLNVTEAILDKVICRLKKVSWGSRWYKDEGQYAFGGTSGVSSGDESGVYIDDLGYDGIDYYYHIEDVSYKDYYGGDNIPAGKNINPDDIVPHLARLHIQATYKEFVKTIQCELKFREPARLEPTMLYVQNYKILSNPDKLDLSDSENLEVLKEKGQEIFEKARRKREENRGLNTIIEMVQQLKLRPGGELADPNNMEKFASADIDPAQSGKEKRIAEYLWKARQVFRDFEVEKFNIVATATVGPSIDNNEAIDDLLKALKLADTLPPEYKQERFPECLYYLGVCYMVKGDVTAGSPIKNSISDPDPVRQATIPLVQDHGEKLWLVDTPPASIPAGSGIVDTDTGYSQRSYSFKLAESCFYTIIKKYSDSKYIPRAYARLYQTKLALSSRWGRAYAQNEARKVMKTLKKNIDNGKYPGYYRVFDEDLRLVDLCRELYKTTIKERIAFCNAMSNGDTGIQVVNIDGSGSIVTLSNYPFGDMNPVWSPDSKEIAFGNRTKESNWEIFVMNADGTGTPRNITRHPSNDFYPTWSPDGQMIAFYSDRNYNIHIVNADGSGSALILTNDLGYGCNPRWSPDGKQIAFQFQEPGNNHRLCTTNVDNNDTSINIIYEESFCDNPAWSPDGEKILFERYFSEFITNSDFVRIRKVSIINSDGSGALMNIIDDSTKVRSPCWSPDGNRIALALDENADKWTFCLGIINTNGSGTIEKVMDDLIYKYPFLSWAPIMKDPFPDIFGP